MIKIKNILLFFLFLIGVFHVKAQNQRQWKALSSPFFSDLKKIQFIAKDTAFISGKQLLILTDGKVSQFPIQPPCEITTMSAVSSDCIYVSNSTNYQNSNLYKWNGEKWEQLYNPMANNIADMSFTDKKNGVAVAYGEINQMINDKWYPINPPNNRGINSVFQNNKDLYILTLGKGVYKYNKRWIAIKKTEQTRHISKIKDHIFVIGYDFLGRIQSDSIVLISKNKIWNSINSVTKNKKGEVIGVGNQGTIIRLLNGKISHINSLVEQDLHQIYNSNNQLWCIGSEGTILTYTEKKIVKKSVWKGFEKITFNNQAKVIDDEYGVIAADFNKDGYTDIFTCGLFEQEHLYINQKSDIFLNQTEEFQIGNTTNTIKELHLGACAGDLDKDGYLDIYLNVLNGKNKIYKNIKGKYFVPYSNTTKGVGKPTDRTNASIMGDVDNDGDLDIFITNEYSTNRLFINNGVGIFTEITQEAGLETQEGGNAATFGDIDKDGDIDLYVTTWSSTNILYKNLFMETGKIHFKNATLQSNTGGKAYAKSNAAVFSDLDNDGDLDLFVTNRKTSNRIYINNAKGVFTDKTETLIGLDTDSSYGAVIADFDGDLYKDIYVSNVGENVFYKNNGKTFTKQTQKYGASIKGYSTGSAVADFDKDGDLDIYIANYIGESSALLRNNKKESKQITLQITGVKNTTNAIGAKVYVYAKNRLNKTKNLLWFDEIRAGSGYVSVNDFKKVIPLKNQDTVFVQVVYPNGIIKNSTAITTGSTLKISDIENSQKLVLTAKQLLKKALYDSHNLFELIKWIFILLLVAVSGFLFQKKHHWNPIYVLFGSLLFIGFYFLQYYYFEYKPFLYATMLPLSSIVIGVLFTYYFFEQKYVKQIATSEKNKIKTQLSRNLHDDLASTVTSIGFYLTLIRFNLKEKNIKILGFIEKSESLLQEATDAITDLIWSINPKPETLKTLLLRIQKNYKPIFTEKGIALIIPLNASILTNKVKDTTKQNTYLILKEALNNILKYAEATQVSIQIKKASKEIVLSIHDNGKGFDYTRSKHKGHGLSNMQKRAEEMQASIKIDSLEGTGTRVTLVFTT